MFRLGGEEAGPRGGTVPGHQSSCRTFSACLISAQGEVRIMEFHCPPGTAYSDTKVTPKANRAKKESIFFLNCYTLD